MSNQPELSAAAVSAAEIVIDGAMLSYRMHGLRVLVDLDRRQAAITTFAKLFDPIIAEELAWEMNARMDYEELVNDLSTTHPVTGGGASYVVAELRTEARALLAKHKKTE